MWDLTSAKAGLKYRKISANLLPHCIGKGQRFRFMTSKPFSQSQKPTQPCKHPRVQIVSRDEDAEFLECLECREIFESSELKDMSIEERVEKEAQES